MTRHRTPVYPLIAAALSGAAALPAAGQFDFENVELRSRISLSTFGSNSGNDCWGYVSPSGREYALMGLSNKVAFVEITDPDNPVWFDSVPHDSTVWCDIKTYQDFCYIVTEGSGTGIQVVDLSDIDNHNIDHVRSLGNPDTSHNVAIDEVSGFLYTAGSRGGSDYTVIYDLTNKSNPTMVGTWGTYEHDIEVITYTSGPYNGRQIMFGASEGRGLDIVDVTNKANPILLARLPYPDVSYAHQVWVDEDRQFAYLNDELDAINRTSVFDISDLEEPFHVNDFASGTDSTDHNEYIRDGYLFQADYTSGLRIYDLNQSPLTPPQLGFFDTHPETDEGGFDGAWSCYPFFPSGIVIVSDDTRGLFVLDPSDAFPGGGTDVTAVEVATGTILEGGVNEIGASDDAYLHTRSGFGITFIDLHHTDIRITAVTTVDSPATIDITVEERIDEPSGTGSVSLWNVNTNAFDQVGSFPLGMTDEVHEVTGVPAGDYIAGDGTILVQVKHRIFVPIFAYTFDSWLDEVRVDVN